MYIIEDIKKPTSEAQKRAYKKYYAKNKAKFCTKYKHLRSKWDAAHKAYLNEHSRLSKQIRTLKSEYNVNAQEIKSLLEKACANKEYLRELHSRGLI